MGKVSLFCYNQRTQSNMEQEYNYIEKKILTRKIFSRREILYYLNLKKIGQNKNIKMFNALLKMNDYIFKLKKIRKKEFKRIEKIILFNLKKALEKKLK